MMYPLLFEPIEKVMLWGKELWDISCRENEMSVISNGSRRGETFDSFIKSNPARVLGTKFCNAARFPLLIKRIYADLDLSVQVHPNDEYAARQNGHDSGKTEAWYVLKPPESRSLVIGLTPGVTREEMKTAYETGRVEQKLNHLPVKAGDLINIPAGLVHAITAGAVLLEIQQNSDITYRLYDYNRLDAAGNPRELHVEHSLNVTDFSGRITPAVADNVNGDYFNIHKHEIAEIMKTTADSFGIISCVSGELLLIGKSYEVKLTCGQSAFLPAGLGEFTVNPTNDNAKFLYTKPKKYLEQTFD